ncbi:hypothetical protein [Vibrio parahaemolyticus]|uniref:hypothetical protein n=1 Tax=Vibrio parahaemolyticus TaxID=670 RepID=UPI0012F95757|nr:hypothetical protein [Vibrio parahaemolyticus]MUT56048.1 hypothetical protein [Vibrio parahaemolyticus]
MIGFVSALSSSLAVIILIMAVMMINMVKSSQSSMSKDDIIPIDQTGGGNKEETISIKDISKRGSSSTILQLNPNIVTQDVLDKLTSSNGIENVKVYCEYGNNFDYSVASSYTTFNIIVISSKVSKNTKVIPVKPIESLNSINKCYVEYE